jgi:hypothetical protein
LSQIFCRAITESAKIASIQYNPAIGNPQLMMRKLAQGGLII